ncbi:TPA: TRAP transporter substrate-binding protein DctP [Pseudomonas aeruginosa]
MHTNPRRGLARRFAAGLLAAALGLGLGLGGSLAQAATTLNLSYNGAADSEKNLVHLFASNLKRLAEEKSGGELQFKLYPNSMLGEEEQRMEQVMTGPGLNIASFAGIAPLFPEIYVSATPFMFKDAAAAHAFFDSGSYWQAAREAFRERTGTELLAVVEEGGFLNFTNGKKPIHGPADFQGLRFRAMDPSQVALYEAFGASGTPIPWTELYMGLRTSVADGQMNPTSYIILGSLYQVQKYLTLANIQYSDQFLVANGDLLASLPAKERQALLDAAAEATRLNREAVAAQQERDLAFLKEKGMQIIQPSADDLAAFREKGQPSYLAWLKTQDIEPRWTEMAFRDAGLATAP